MDELDVARRDRNYNEINKIVDSLANLTVFPALAWLWTWDIVRDIFDNHQYEDSAESDYEYIPEGTTLKQIWDKFWEDADKNGWSLEYGSEDVAEAVREWMYDCDFLIYGSEDEEEEE